MVRRIAATAVGELLEREGALRSLTAVLDDAEHGHGAVVVVSGEPGIGKTALVARFASEVGERARLLLGICDDLTTPRPLGPFRDIADQLPEPITSQLSNGATPGEFATLLVRELRHAGCPTILVIEDVHWIDQATIDVLTVIGRRAAELPVVLVVTLRPGELAPDDPVRGAISAIRRSTTLHLELAPLSHAAVAQLAGDQVDRIHEMSRGNPFFVTELVAHGHAPPPPSLANAVLGRVGRLEPSLRHLLELICVVPGRVSVEVLDLLEPAWAQLVEQAERQRILHIDRRHVRFHHELSRAALHSSLPWGRRRQLHSRIVDALLELGADPADLAHHAAAAGRGELAAGYALLAGRQAAASGAHREALAHLRRAADEAQDRLGAAEQASLHEELGRSAWLTGRIEESLSAISTAIDVAGALDDVALHGRCLALRAHVYWFSGDGAAAWNDASDAVRILKSAGPSSELAGATAQAAALSMALSRIDDAQRWGHRTLELAGDRDDLRVRARSAIGGSRLQLDVVDADDLLAAVELARDTEDMEQVVFSLITLAVLHLHWVRPDQARTHAEQASNAAREHEFEAMTAFVNAFRAWLDLREGHPDAAARLVGVPVSRARDKVGSLAEQQARIVLAERAVRVGADDAVERLHDVVSSADRTRMLVHIAPVLELEVEHALNEDAPLPRQRFEQLTEVVGHQPLRTGCSAARIAAWAALCGRTVDFRGKAPAPYAAMIDRDWAGAADAFGAVGWRHDRALLLSLVPERDALAEALSIARSLGAAPLETRVCRRMRSLGLSVPRGPRASTQGNPAQLTERQLEVYRHLATGRTNTQIAEVLHISPRTAEHHVASILAKLKVTSRAEAVARAVELGLP